MYPLYFYICLIASVASVIILILLAVFPINIPFVPKTPKTKHTLVNQRKARSPTPRPQVVSYWDPLNDDNENL